ncbi:MAG: hypothetical protein R3F59_38345 [Myxococcota bacterium]
MADDDRAARLQADLANVRRHQGEAVDRARREGQAQGLLARPTPPTTCAAPSTAPPRATGRGTTGWPSCSKVRGRTFAATGAVELGAVGERSTPRATRPCSCSASRTTSRHGPHRRPGARRRWMLRPAGVLVGR